MNPYGKPGRVDWILRVFVTLCVLLLVGVIAFGIAISRDGGTGFKNLMGGSASKNPLELQR